MAATMRIENAAERGQTDEIVQHLSKVDSYRPIHSASEKIEVGKHAYLSRPPIMTTAARRLETMS